MKLYNGTIRPGKVLSVEEPGIIKASAPGLFSAEDHDNLPPIYPFFNIMGAHTRCYSEPTVGDEIWIMNFSDNPMQLYWFRKDNYKDNDIINDTNVEIICDRRAHGGSASIYFSDGTGWVITSSGAKININKEGNILLSSSDGMIIDINNGISLGAEGKSSHTACYADECKKVLNDIVNVLNIIEDVSGKNVYTKHINVAIKGKADKIKNNIPDIESHKVTLE